MSEEARKWLNSHSEWKGAFTFSEPAGDPAEAAKHLSRLLVENERLRQSKWGMEYLKLKRIIANLREQLDEHDAYYRKVVNDECAPDEIHCTCVPALRDKIDTFQADRDALVALGTFARHAFACNMSSFNRDLRVGCDCGYRKAEQAISKELKELIEVEYIVKGEGDG